MVTSLNRSSEEDSGSRPPPDPIAEALEAISSPRFGVDVAASTTARSRSRPPVSLLRPRLRLRRLSPHLREFQRGQLGG